MNTAEAKYKLIGVHPGTNCLCTMLCSHGHPIAVEPGTILKIGKGAIEIACEIPVTDGDLIAVGTRMCISYEFMKSISGTASGCRINTGNILIDITISEDQAWQN